MVDSFITTLMHPQVSPLLDGSARQWLWNNTRPINSETV